MQRWKKNILTRNSTIDIVNLFIQRNDARRQTFIRNFIFFHVSRFAANYIIMMLLVKGMELCREASNSESLDVTEAGLALGFAETKSYVEPWNTLPVSNAEAYIVAETEIKTE